MDNNQEDNIRPADPVIQDRLLEDTRCEFQKQMDDAMYLSLKEINELQNINNKFEEQIITNFNLETRRRTDIFKDLLFNLNKIKKFDNEVREIYDIIDPIIEAYCGQYFETCELDSETYNKIFRILEKIRNNQTALEHLKKIILREENNSFFKL